MIIGVLPYFLQEQTYLNAVFLLMWIVALIFVLIRR